MGSRGFRKNGGSLDRGSFAGKFVLGIFEHFLESGGSVTGFGNFEIGEIVVRELLAVSKGKTLIAVTHDERLAQYFDVTVDMNEMTGGDTNA